MGDDDSMSETPPWDKRRTNYEKPLKNVAVVGGTHGCEICGVYVAKYFKKNPRYVETDMNRCFLLKDLNDEKLQTLENKRAREIDAQLGPKDSENPAADLVLDLHNTTANTGFLLLMAPFDDFSHLVGAYLMSMDP